MNRIDHVFGELRERNRRGLMPFVVGGRPTVAQTGELLAALDGAGASVIEVGIPFSDPIADGPVIAAAMHEALESGATVAGVFEQVRAARGRVGAALVAMVSVSIVERVGEAAFVERARDAGFDGFIFPDLPVDESESLMKTVRDAGLGASMLLAPTTPPARAERIVRASSGFVYMLARTGITGERSDAPEIGDRVAQIRSMTDLPIACGFGISTADQVRAVVEHADAAIVGSALVRRIEAAVRSGEDAIETAGAFARDLASGLGRP